MAIIYRTAGPWGGGQASDLTPDQVDGNFWDHEARIVLLEDIDPGVGIDYFEIVGNQLTVHMTDNSTRGPYVIPTALFIFKGAWAATTLYLVNDIITNNGSTYLVTFDHTSDSTFDPGANDGSGHNFYGLLLSNPGNSLPTGGDVPQVLAKRTTADYDVEWVDVTFDIHTDVALVSPRNDGDVLTWNDSLNKWTNAAITAPFPDTGVRGGVESLDAIATFFVTGLGTDGILTVAQPDFTDLSGVIDEAQLLQTTHQAVSQTGGNITLNRANGEVVSTTLSANISNITLSGWPAPGLLGRIIWDITQGAGAFSVGGYPGAVKIPGGAGPPTISTGTGEKDRLIFTSWDGGTNVLLDVAGQNYS